MTMKPWKEIYNSPKWRQASEEVREIAREKYFNAVSSAYAPEVREQKRQAFYARYPVMTVASDTAAAFPAPNLIPDTNVAPASSAAAPQEISKPIAPQPAQPSKTYQLLQKAEIPRRVLGAVRSAAGSPKSIADVGSMLGGGTQKIVGAVTRGARGFINPEKQEQLSESKGVRRLQSIEENVLQGAVPLLPNDQKTKALKEEFPITSAVSEAGGTIGSALLGGSGAAKALQFIKNPFVRTVFLRAGVNTALTGAKQLEEVFSGRKDLRGAVRDTLIDGTGSALASIIPEIGFPAKRVYQMFGQPGADLLYNAIVSKLKGETIDSIWLKDQLPQVGISAAFASLDAKNIKEFQKLQSEMRKGINFKTALGKLSALMRKNSIKPTDVKADVPAGPGTRVTTEYDEFDSAPDPYESRQQQVTEQLEAEGGGVVPGIKVEPGVQEPAAPSPQPPRELDILKGDDLKLAAKVHLDNAIRDYKLAVENDMFERLKSIFGKNSLSKKWMEDNMPGEYRRMPLHVKQQLFSKSGGRAFDDALKEAGIKRDAALEGLVSSEKIEVPSKKLSDYYEAAQDDYNNLQLSQANDPGVVDDGSYVKGPSDVTPKTAVDPIEQNVSAQTGKKTVTKRAIESEAVSPDVREGLKQGEIEYYVKPNDPILQQARTEVEQNSDAVLLDFLGKDTATQEDIIRASALREKYSQNNETDKEIQLTEHLANLAVKAGQSVQAFRIWNNVSPGGFVKRIQKAIDKAGVVLGDDEMAKIKQMAYDAYKNPQGSEARDNALKDLYRHIADYMPWYKKLGSMWQSYKYSNMLSGPGTTLRNTYTNALNSFLVAPLNIAASRDVKGALRYIHAAAQNHGNALREFGKVMRGSADTGKWQDFGEQSALDIAMRQGHPKFLRVVGEFMEAQDKYFSTMIEAGETSRLIRKGVAPEEAAIEAQRVAEQYLMRTQIGDDFRRLSKTGKGNPFVAGLDGIGLLLEQPRKLARQSNNRWGKAAGEVYSWMVPFIKVPVNWGKLMIKGSPLGFIGSGQKATDYAMAGVGTSVLTLGASLAAQGRTTWEAPKGEKERESFYASGRRPYSVLIGNTWVPMKYFGPYMLALGAPAAFRDKFQDDPNSIGKDKITNATRMATSLLKFYSSEVPLAGIANFWSILSGEEGTDPAKLTGMIATQAIPASGMQRWINGFVDGEYRKVDSKTFAGKVGQTIMRGTPGLSKGLESHKTPSGDPSLRLLRNQFLPFQVGVQDQNYENEYQSLTDINRGKKSAKIDAP